MKWHTSPMTDEQISSREKTHNEPFNPINEPEDNFIDISENTRESWRDLAQDIIDHWRQIDPLNVGEHLSDLVGYELNLGSDTLPELYLTLAAGGNYNVLGVLLHVPEDRVIEISIEGQSVEIEQVFDTTQAPYIDRPTEEIFTPEEIYDHNPTPENVWTA